MRMAQLHHRVDRSHIDAGYNHRLYPTLLLAGYDFFAIGFKSFFINMTMGVDHWIGNWLLVIGDWLLVFSREDGTVAV